MQLLPLNITATPSMGQNGQISWSLCNDAGKCGSGNGLYPPIDLAQNAPGRLIKIAINDTNNLGITFAAGQSAMWVQPGQNNCPQSSVWDPGNPAQLTGFTRTDNTHIQFNDVNNNTTGVQYFSYRLNFVNANGQSVTSIDPIIKNGGIGLVHPPSTNSELIESALIALVVALIVSLIVSWIVARNVARSGRE